MIVKMTFLFQYLVTFPLTCDTFPEPVKTKERGPKCAGSFPIAMSSPSSNMANLAARLFL